MITKKIMLGLIAASGIIFLFTGVRLISVLALIFGVTWLALELYDIPASMVFFLSFAGLAVVSGLNGAPVALSLLGFSTALASWDLSRFYARITLETPGEKRASLETKHLQQLAIIVCGGYLVALLPTLIELSLGFGVVFLVVVLAILTLRKSILYL